MQLCSYNLIIPLSLSSLHFFTSTIIWIWGRDFFCLIPCTAWKVSVFGVILVHIFPYSDWIRRDMVFLRIQSEWGKYGHFLRSVIVTLCPPWKQDVNWTYIKRWRFNLSLVPQNGRWGWLKHVDSKGFRGTEAVA